MVARTAIEYRQNGAKLVKDYSDKKVVVIDDNEMNLNVAVLKLKRYGMITTKGDSAKELFTLLKDNSYDLLILDDMMPEMSGTEAMQRLKSENYRVPIVVLTGNTENENARRNYLSAGFDEFLAKPLNDGELDRVLNMFLGS